MTNFTNLTCDDGELLIRVDEVAAVQMVKASINKTHVYMKGSDAPFEVQHTYYETIKLILENSQ